MRQWSGCLVYICVYTCGERDDFVLALLRKREHAQCSTLILFFLKKNAGEHEYAASAGLKDCVRRRIWVRTRVPPAGR